jgi:hypothetical protein
VRNKRIKRKKWLNTLFTLIPPEEAEDEDAEMRGPREDDNEQREAIKDLFRASDNALVCFPKTTQTLAYVREFDGAVEVGGDRLARIFGKNIRLLINLQQFGFTKAKSEVEQRMCRRAA